MRPGLSALTGKVEWIPLRASVSRPNSSEGQNVALASPCVDVCKMNRQADLCIGCFRSLAEIADWQILTDQRRREIIAERPQRETRLARLRALDNG